MNMGTNYYVAENTCECCNRYDETYHIGKSSFGWTFCFQGYKEYNLISWKSWKDFLKDKTIKNEYGDTMSYDDFVNMIEVYKSPNFTDEQGRKNLQHNAVGKTDKYPWFNPSYDWDDDDGYPFTSKEFS